MTRSAIYGWLSLGPALVAGLFLVVALVGPDRTAYALSAGSGLAACLLLALSRR